MVQKEQLSETDQQNKCVFLNIIFGPLPRHTSMQRAYYTKTQAREMQYPTLDSYGQK